jgi:hypothetical protein
MITDKRDRICNGRPSKTYRQWRRSRMAIATRCSHARELPHSSTASAFGIPTSPSGGGSCYLKEDFYNNEVALAGEPHKDVFVGVFKRGDELVGMWSWEQVPDTCAWPL